MRAQPGDVLFRIADHRLVWVLLDVAERDLGRVASAQNVTVRATRPARPRLFRARSSADLSASQRADAHRAHPHRSCPIPTNCCGPNMYVDAEIETGTPGPVLAVPESAVLDSGSAGRRSVDKGEGRFEPREVKLGQRGGGYVEIRRRRRRRRGRRRLGQLPDRRRKQSEGGAEGICGARQHTRRMIRPPHRLVGPQPAAGAVRHRLCGRGRHLRADPSAARCHSRSLRHPGHRLHRISRPGAAGDRGPGHLSADDRDADRAEVEGGARLLVLRRLVRLRHLRGRHRHLLGALARARIPQRRDLAVAGRRDADHRPGRDRRRLGLPVRGDVEGVEPRRHAHDPGLESASSRWPRRRASPKSPASAASSSSTTSSSIRSACATSASPCRRCATRSAPATPTSAAAPSSCPSSNTSSAARAI